MKTVKKNLYDPVFTAEVIVVCNASSDQLKRLLKDNVLENPEFFDSMDGGIALVDKIQKDGGKIRSYIVWLRNRKNFYTLLHESLHLVQHIFTDRGIPFASQNDETIAYYQTYWFKKIWRLINK